MLQNAINYPAERITANTRLNFEVAILISADEITPIQFSKAKFFRQPTYGLFVEIREDGVLYTIRKAGKAGYAEIIERDACYESICDIWTIYENA